MTDRPSCTECGKPADIFREAERGLLSLCLECLAKLGIRWIGGSSSQPAALEQATMEPDPPK